MAFLAKWFRYNVFFSKAVVFIWGLILVHAWAESGLVLILITHLTGDNYMSLEGATAVVNLLHGITGILVVIMAYLSETYLGPYLSLVCTTTAYIFGLLLFYHRGLVLVAVVLLGLGRAGRDAHLKDFLTDQCSTDSAAEDEEKVEIRRNVWWSSANVLGVMASAFLFTKASWTTLCLIILIAMVVAFVLFLLGTAFYERKKPAKTTLKNMLRVLYTVITNRRQRHPLDYHRVNIHTLSILNRWVDIAAVEESSDGRVCTVEQTQVQSLLTMIPIWLTFLVYGLVRATANTFFYQQTNYTANYLAPIHVFSEKQSDYSCNDPRLNISKKVPVIIFVIIRFSARLSVSRLCDLLSWSGRGDEKISLRMLVRCGVGLAVSPICCLVAWRIEEYRVHQRMNNGICIWFPWLIPQFVLVGLMEGIVLDALQKIYTSVVSESLHLYGPPFTQFALSIGHFLSLLFISIFHNLFHDIDLNLSKLGVYYNHLTYACFANLVIYCWVARYYAKLESCNADEDEDEDEELPLEQLDSPEVLKQDNILFKYLTTREKPKLFSR